MNRNQCPDCGVLEGQQHKDHCRQKSANYPYIQYPPICAKCGKTNPQPFHVEATEWTRYIQEDKQDMVLCRECYDFIKIVIDFEASQ